MDNNQQTNMVKNQNLNKNNDYNNAQNEINLK